MAAIVPVILAAQVAVLFTAGCVASYGPHFTPDIATALAHEPMSRIETTDIFLYHPTKRREEALRFLERIEGCVAYWRNEARVHNRLSTAKLNLVMPEMPLNNAYVEPRNSGYEDVGVIPTFNTLDFFTLESGLPPDPAFVGCHEVTHYVQFQQIAGFAWFLNTVFGELYSPQVGFDPWFDEGLAVYSETILQPGTGRLAWPFWNGVFAAAVAGKRVNGGDLSAFNRVFDGGNHYLFGSQFVRFLAERYGEARLWRLIEIQGHSIFFPLWVNLRFWQAYDKTLSTLIDEFADDTAARFPPIERPAGQRTIRDAGTNARYARAPDGTEAVVTEDLDRPSRVEVYAPDGGLILERDLIDVLPPRDLKISAPTLTGGLSFSADGRQLFFAALDLNVTHQAMRLVRLDVAANELAVVASDLRGSGGSISPDGRRYLFARAEGDRHDLVELDLERGVQRTIVEARPRHYLTNPRYSPNGRYVVATSFDGQRFGIAVLSATDGRTLATVPVVGGAPGPSFDPSFGPSFDPSWIDDHRIAFLGVAPSSPGFQVYVRDLAAGTTTLVTHAPYLAFNPHATTDGKAIRFLNREGWRWTLDEVALPTAPLPARTVAWAVKTEAASLPEPPLMLAAASAPPSVTAAPTSEPDQPPPATPAPVAPPAPPAPPPTFAPAPPATTTPPPSPAAPAAPPQPQPQPQPPAPATPPQPQPAAPAAPPQPTAPATPPPQPPPPYGYPAPGYAPYPPPYPPPPPPAPPRLPPGTLPPAVSLPPVILGEEPYSGTDHLLFPLLHTVDLLVLGRAGDLYGLSLAGGDRLSFHRWSLSGYYQPQPGASATSLGSGLFSFGAGYSNSQLAPFTLSIAASQFQWRDIPPQPPNAPPITDADFTLRKRQRNAQASVERDFYGNPVQVFFLLTEDSEPDDAAVPVPLRRLAGPGLSASYTGVESTPYTDERRLAHVGGTAVFYPQAWSTLGFGFVDLFAQAQTTLPLPLSRRHTLRLGLRGRALAGAPDSAPILQVGGVATGFLYHRSDRAPGPDFDHDTLPPAISLFDPLRGYEDYALATTRVAIADASYRYPLIIDWGSASTFGVLPAFFLRQINLELFFAGALTGREGTRHAAAGAAIGVDFALLTQWSLQYQLAQRLEDDRARVHAILLALGW